jgi:hypothetical protein
VIKVFCAINPSSPVIPLKNILTRRDIENIALLFLIDMEARISIMYWQFPGSFW